GTASRPFASSCSRSSRPRRRCPSCASCCATRSSTRARGRLGSATYSDPRARAAPIGDVPGDADELLRNFLLVLADKGRTGQLEEIAREFERLVAEHEGVVHAELTTAADVSDDEDSKR